MRKGWFFLLIFRLARENEKEEPLFGFIFDLGIDAVGKTSNSVGLGGTPFGRRAVSEMTLIPCS